MHAGDPSLRQQAHALSAECGLLLPLPHVPRQLHIRACQVSISGREGSGAAVTVALRAPSPLSGGPGARSSVAVTPGAWLGADWRVMVLSDPRKENSSTP